jgi:4,5-DOPA dioxygenase extradiol
MRNNPMSVETNKVMPAVFVSHGSPMTALDRGPYAEALAAFGKRVEPSAIVVISAHWQEPGIRIASGAKPELIYDFGGFPQELYELRYDAPGAPELAAEVKAELDRAGFAASLDERRGWDHGVWVPLRLMFPQARIPVVAISLPYRQSPEELYRVGKAIGPLRERGALILGSGGIVHNLRLMNWAEKDAAAEMWALEFQNWVRNAIEKHDLAALFSYEQRAPHAKRAAPTAEHFVPLFPVLGAAGEQARLTPVYEGVEYGNMSMFTFELR